MTKPKIALWLALAATSSGASVSSPVIRDVLAPTDHAPGGPVADSTRVAPNDNRTPAGLLRNGTLSLRLVARVALWRPEGPSGLELPVYAFAEEGRVPRIPGPMIRVPMGTEVRATIRNSLPQPLRLFGFNDRPTDRIDSLELLPGERKEVRFRAGAPGTFLYWARTSRDTFPFGHTEDGQLSGAIPDACRSRFLIA